MIKTYEYKADLIHVEASVKIEIDTTKFTEELAKATLEFFTWDYDEHEDPIVEVSKKYAIEAIRIATLNNYTLYGVVSEFDSHEGFAKVDGSLGIKIVEIEGFDHDSLFDDMQLELEHEV